MEVLQSSAGDVAGCQGSENIKEPSINMLTWGRFVKDVINARTSAGKTPLMLACEKGCAEAPPHYRVHAHSGSGTPCPPPESDFQPDLPQDLRKESPAKLEAVIVVS